MSKIIKHSTHWIKNLYHLDGKLLMLMVMMLMQYLKLIIMAKAPLVIICKTIKGKGVSYMENVPIWHYRSPNIEEYKQAIKEINDKHRNKFADTFLKLSREDKKLCIVVADISPAGAMNDFRLEFQRGLLIQV